MFETSLETDRSMDYQYVGQELDLFAAATRWKSYFRGHLKPFIGDDVLEVGAGLGGTTRLLCAGSERRWVCLEPDAVLAGRLQGEIDAARVPAHCQVRIGTLADLPAEPAWQFDTLLYIDVLEHIEHDAAEVAQAADALRPGGHLIVLSPAHPWLFTTFDTHLGHFRRYTRSSLAALTPDNMHLKQLRYLDSVGMLASLGNRLLLKSALPTARQIAIWDKLMVPCSRVVDPLTAHRLGKSIIAIWEKQ